MIESKLFAVFTAFFFALTQLIALKKLNFNRFSYLLLYSELYTFLGVSVGLLVLVIGGLNGILIFNDYVDINGPISKLTLLHIIFYSLGSLFASCNTFSFKKGMFGRVYKKFQCKKCDLFKYLIFGSLCIVLYGSLFGLEASFSNAALVRAGQLDLVEEPNFLFLKNIASIGVLGTPFIILYKGNGKALSFICITLYGLLLFFFTASRTALLDTFFVSCLIFFATSPNLRIYGAKSIVTILLAAILILFGKYFLNKDYELDYGAIGFEDSIYNIISQFANILFSIDAGIKNFLTEGPFFGNSLMLSYIGLLPTKIFSLFDLSLLDWQSYPANDNIVCVNSSFFGREDCIMPPYYLGVSAYAFPLLFGLVFGYFKFAFYSRLSDTWKNSDCIQGKVFVVLFLMVFSKFTLFVPTLNPLLMLYMVVIWFFNLRLKNVK